ncbi:MAG: shikimate 5-dehydrogenase [Saprospiraceae bacterium]|nr:MAG: shikimate 5-dehydrogenase [Saprospiraceae bacterium]
MKFKQLFGLIGYPLSHSFSKKYFNEKFIEEGLSEDFYYELFPLERIELFPELLVKYEQFRGINVTIPYKQQIIPFLDILSDEASAIGAVNTILIKNGQSKGYNTDVYGFEKSLTDKLENAGIQPENALILGTGGAAKAVHYVLEKKGINFSYVSRNKEVSGVLTYQELTEKIIKSHQLIINTTPLGMYPKIDTLPNIPYHYLGKEHLLFDLVYNPKETAFLKEGKKRKSTIINGLEMLHLQAEQAWTIWTS